MRATRKDKEYKPKVKGQYSETLRLTSTIKVTRDFKDFHVTLAKAALLTGETLLKTIFVAFEIVVVREQSVLE